MNSPPKLLPAALGGLFIGILSALPLVRAANCCCLWIVAGGYLAAYVMQQNHSSPITTADGAVAGFLAGIVGAFVYTVVVIPIDVVMGPLQARFFLRLIGTNSDLPPPLREMLENIANGRSSILLTAVLGFSSMLLIGMVVGPIGGMLGVLFSGRPPHDRPTPPGPESRMELPPEQPPAPPSLDPWPPRE